MKKIAYISSPHFADCDIPLLKELQQLTNVIYILQVSNSTKSMSAINIQQIKSTGGIFHASEFKGTKKLAQYLDLSKVYILNFPGKHDWSLSNILAIIRLVYFLIRKKIDIIHLTWPPRYGAFLIYTLYKKIILTVHDPLPHSGQDTWLNRLHRFVAFSLIKNFILLNKSQKQEFISKYNLRNKNIYHSQLSIYAHLLTVSPSSPIIESDYFLFFGKIDKYKGLYYLCKAMEIIHTKNKDIKLIIAGKGKTDFDISPYLATNSIFFINRYITDEELVGLIKKAQFVVCPYIDATQSGVIMSSFALNKPVIATHTGGLPEMVIDKRYGLIIPPKDEIALANAISTLWNDKSLLSALATNIENDYKRGRNSWLSIAKDINNIYEYI